MAVHTCSLVGNGKGKGCRRPCKEVQSGVTGVCQHAVQVALPTWAWVGGGKLLTPVGGAQRLGTLLVCCPQES